MNDGIAVAHLRRRVRVPWWLWLLILPAVGTSASALASMVAAGLWFDGPLWLRAALIAQGLVVLGVSVASNLVSVSLARGVGRIRDRVVVTADGVRIGDIAVMPFWALDRCEMEDGVLTLETPVTAVEYDVDPGSPFAMVLASAKRTWAVLHAPAPTVAGPFRWVDPGSEQAMRLVSNVTSAWVASMTVPLAAFLGFSFGPDGGMVALGLGALCAAGSFGGFRWAGRHHPRLVVGPDAALLGQSYLPFREIRALSREGDRITIEVGKQELRFTDAGDATGFDALLAAWSKR